MTLEIKHKQYTNTDLKVEDGSREIVAVISTASVDRHGEVVLPKGMSKKNFQGNPVVLVNHNHNSLPIGIARWVKADNDTVISKYFISDKTQEARDVFGLLQDGILQAHSIGFQALEESPPTNQEIKKYPDWAMARNVIRKWELLEFSIVGIPANPEALALAVSKSLSPEVKGMFQDQLEQKETSKIIKGISTDLQNVNIKTLGRNEMLALIASKINDIGPNVDYDRVIYKALKALTSK